MPKQFIRIVNWRNFQHYKDRNPPWIKLHQELLTSQTWVTGDDATRALAIACMLLASRTDNKIPHDLAYIQRVGYLHKKPDLSQLIETQFIEIVDETGDASVPLASASTLHANARPEEEKEAEEEEETKKSRAKKTHLALTRKLEKRKSPDSILVRIYEGYPRRIARGAAYKAIDRALVRIAKEKSCSREDAADFLYQAVVKFGESPAGKKGEYTPHPATWFNADKFFDDPQEWWKVNTNGNSNGNSETIRAAADRIAAREIA